VTALTYLAAYIAAYLGYNVAGRHWGYTLRAEFAGMFAAMAVFAIIFTVVPPAVVDIPNVAPPAWWVVRVWA